MKRKILTFLFSICLILPCFFILSACGDKPPEGNTPPQTTETNIELAEFKTIATNIIQSYRENETTLTPASYSLNNQKNKIFTLSKSNNTTYIDDIKQNVKDYEYKESIDDISQYRETLFNQLFYLPIGCGEVLEEELGIKSFYGSKIKYYEEPITIDNTTTYCDSYFTINKSDNTITMTIYEEFFENDISVSDTYTYIILNYINEGDYNARLVTYTSDMKYLSFTYLDSNRNFIDLQYDLINIKDQLGNTIESYNLLTSDGVNSYLLTDKDTTLECKNILTEIDNPTTHNTQILNGKENFTQTINIKKINLKMQSFMQDMANFEVPAPIFIVENGILTGLDYRNTTDKTVLTIPGNVTALLYEGLTVSSNVNRIIIPSTVEKLLITKETYQNIANRHNLPTNLPTIDNKYIELPLEYVEQQNFSLFRIFNAENNQYIGNFKFSNITFGDDCSLFNIEANGNTYLNVRTANNIIEDNNTYVNYLVEIRDYESFFGDDFVLNIVNRNESSDGNGNNPAYQIFKNTDKNLAEKLYSNALFYASSINITIEDPNISILDNICTFAMMEYYGLKESYNIEKYDPCLFTIQNITITDNLLPEYRQDLDNTWFNFSIKYFKEIKNLTIQSNYAKMYSLSSQLKNNYTSLSSHKIDNITLGEGITGLQLENFELQTNGISFPSTMKNVNFMFCKLIYNGNLNFSNLKELKLPNSTQTSFSDVALYLNGNLTIDASNFDNYIFLNDIKATGDIVINIGKDVVDLRYNSIEANSVTLKLDFTDYELESFIENNGNVQYTLANTLKNILNDNESIFTIETKFGVELKSDIEGLTYNNSTQTYSYNVRNNITNLDLSTFVKTENVIVKVNTSNDFNSAENSNAVLNVGNNTFYILAKNIDGEDIVSFKINIYRNKMFKYRIDAQGGTFDTDVQTEIDIEENVKNYFEFPEYQPIPSKDGYNFYTWYFDDELPTDLNETYYYISWLPIFEYEDGTSKIYLQPTSDITIYAHYQESTE